MERLQLTEPTASFSRKRSTLFVALAKKHLKSAVDLWQKVCAFKFRTAYTSALLHSLRSFRKPTLRQCYTDCKLQKRAYIPQLAYVALRQMLHFGTFLELIYGTVAFAINYFLLQFEKRCCIVAMCCCSNFNQLRKKMSNSWALLRTDRKRCFSPFSPHTPLYPLFTKSYCSV